MSGPAGAERDEGHLHRISPWLADRHNAAAATAALLRAVPVLGGLLVLTSTVAGLLALGIIAALAVLATGGVPAAAWLVVLLLAEAGAHGLTGFLATLCDRRLVGALRARVMTAFLRPTATDALARPELDAARGVGIRREPKPGAALPGITAWWITVVRRGGAFVLLLTGSWWLAPAAALAWLAAPPARLGKQGDVAFPPGSERDVAGPLGQERHVAFLRTALAFAALTAVLLAVSHEPDPRWRILHALAILALPADQGTTLTRIRQLLRSGANLAATARTLPARLAGADLPGREPPPVPLREIRLNGAETTIVAGRITILTGPAADLVPLLVRLRDPAQGKVIVNDTDLRDIDATAWWRQLAYVPPKPITLPSSLTGNVFLDGTEPQCPLWILDELTDRLPDGARTPLTADLRGGVDLDDDDWHRIALARALVRIERGARLLVVANAGAEAMRVARLARRTHPELTVVLASREPAAEFAGLGQGAEPGP